jgi:hypothetical protein
MGAVVHLWDWLNAVPGGSVASTVVLLAAGLADVVLVVAEVKRWRRRR